jgi:hypothetical protein
MKNALTPLLFAALCSGCAGSCNPAPPPIGPEKTTAAASASASAAPASAPTHAPAPTSVASTDPTSVPTTSPTASPYDEEMARLSKYSAPPEPPPKDLPADARPLRFTEHVPIKSLADIPAAMKAHGEYGMMMADGDKDLEIKSCTQYIKALQEGLSAKDNLEYDNQSTLKKRCVPLWFLSHAWPSRRSFVADLRFDIEAPLSLLPADFDFPVSEERSSLQDQAIARGDSLAMFHRGLKAPKKEATSLVWVDPYAGPMEMTCDIQAFGDIDHDGLEDALLYETAYTHGGHYRAYRHMIVTRKSAKGKLLVIMKPEI